MTDMVNYFVFTDTKDQVALLRQRLDEVKNHRVFGMLKTIYDVQTFMGWHVYAVWDFMSLLKSIQRVYAPTAIPWAPPRNRKTARLINEIVLAEESDVLPDGSHCSHFEMYLQAMKELNVSSSDVEGLAMLASMGVPAQAAISRINLDPAIVAYLDSTFSVVEEGIYHKLLASFLFGREDAIPAMFRNILDKLGINKENIPTFIYYLERHIELDDDEHAPAAAKMLQEQLDGSVPLTIEALNAGIAAVEARIALWDALAAKLESQQVPV